MRAAPIEVERPADVPEWASMRCEPCGGWHHPDYHSTEPFKWGRRVLAHAAWFDTKRLARAWWKAIRG